MDRTELDGKIQRFVSNCQRIDVAVEDRILSDAQTLIQELRDLLRLRDESFARQHSELRRLQEAQHDRQDDPNS